MGRGEGRKQVEYPEQDMEQCFRHFDDMRAADCKKLAESPEGGFRHAETFAGPSGEGSFFIA